MAVDVAMDVVGGWPDVGRAKRKRVSRHRTEALVKAESLASRSGVGRAADPTRSPPVGCYKPPLRVCCAA